MSLEITAIATRRNAPIEANQVLVHDRLGRRVYPWATADDLLRAHLLSFCLGRVPMGPVIPVDITTADYHPETKGYNPLGSTSTTTPTSNWADVALLDHAAIYAKTKEVQAALSYLIENVFSQATAISAVITRVAFFNNMRLKPAQPFSTLDQEIASAVAANSTLASLPEDARIMVQAYILASFAKTGKTQLYGQLLTTWSTNSWLVHPEDIPVLMLDETVDSINALQWYTSGGAFGAAGSSYASTADVDSRVILHLRDLRQTLASLRGRLERVPRCFEAYAFAYFNDSVELNEFSFDEFRTYVNLLPVSGYTGSGISRFVLNNLAEDIRVITSLLARGTARRPIKTISLNEFKSYFTYFDYRANIAIQGQHFSFLLGAVNAKYLGRKTAIVDRSGEVSSFTYAVAERSPYDQRMEIEAFINAIEGASGVAVDYLKSSLIAEFGPNATFNWIGDRRLLMIAAMSVSERSILYQRGAAGSDWGIRFEFRRRADSPATLFPAASPITGMDSDLVNSTNPAAVVALSDRRLGGDKFIAVTDELVTTLTEKTHILTDRVPGIPAGARLSNEGSISIPQWELVTGVGHTMEIAGRTASVAADITLGDFEEAASLRQTQVIIGHEADIQVRINMAILKIMDARFAEERKTTRWKDLISGGAVATYGRYHLGSLIPDLVWRPIFALVSARAQRNAGANMLFDRIPAVVQAIYFLYLDIGDVLLGLLRIGRGGPSVMPAVDEFWQWFTTNVARDPLVYEPHLVSIRLNSLGTGKRGPT